MALEIKNKRIESVLPFIFIPFTLLIATFSLILTLIVMSVLAVSMLYARKLSRTKQKSQCFSSWCLALALTLFFIFEFDVVAFLEITALENLLFLSILSFAVFMCYKAKIISKPEVDIEERIITEDSAHCPICQMDVYYRYFHSLWLDCCITTCNYKYHILGLLFCDAALIYGSNLGLTTICQPYVFYKTILLPYDCSDVYYQFDLALCFVACLYSILLVVVISANILKDLFVCRKKGNKTVRYHNTIL